MKVLLSKRADRDYGELPRTIQRQVDKQLNLLRDNIRHPSIQAKKYDEANDLWQGRVNRDHRFYFKIIGDTYHIATMIRHPK
jgi:mRNA-degrading endonuclease RelE of RelBE toxin-antitoxin system